MCKYTKDCLCEDGEVPMCIPYLERTSGMVDAKMAERHRAEDAEIARDSKYTTYTIVVRNDTDIIAEALDLCADGVQFLWAEEGIAASAFALGADPSSWDDSIEETCQRLYEEGGASAVYSFVQTHYPLMPWLGCDACDTGTPHVDRGNKHVCLVCGTHKEA